MILKCMCKAKYEFVVLVGLMDKVVGNVASRLGQSATVFDDVLALSCTFKQVRLLLCGSCT